MRTLGLDISTRTGWAFMAPFQVLASGLLVSKVDGDFTSAEYPYNYLDMAQFQAKQILQLIEKLDPEVIIIEETNKGRNRYSQKQLEFIHFAVAEAIRHHIKDGIRKLVYIDTSKWRSLLEIEMSKEDRDRNHQRAHQRKGFKDSVEEEVRACFDPEMQEEIDAIDSKRLKKKVAKTYEGIISGIVDEAAGKFRARIDGKMVKHRNKKDVTVELVNSIFQQKFKGRDHDICDSVCLCLGYYELVGVPNAWRTTIHTRS